MGDFMAGQKKGAIPPEKVALYEKAVSALPGVERKGADNPYASLNGNMFSLSSAVTETMALRLPKEEREAFLKKYKSRLFEAYGAVMKEYVTVPDALLRNTKELQKYMALSYEYAKTLKPKAAKKRR
jgi:TfoX/Sxy family transcriptional regulator of competence genes